MKRIAFALLLTIPLACDKDKAPTETPTTGDTSETGDDSADPEPEEPPVPQEPDPPEIEEASHEFMLGHYQETIDKLTPIYQDLKERQQWRAGGLAGGWLALAHAQIVFENAEEPSQHALAMAEKTADPEVKAVAELAHGAFLLGNEDYAAAAAAFDAAAKAAPKSKAGALANILRAEALIGSAFGSSASDQIENPEDLEAAKKAYAAAADAAKGGIEPDIIQGRVEEGLTAIAKYQGNTADICKHAVAAVKHLQDGDASDFLVEGPMKYVADYKCKME
jgi:hypothetical protein